MSLTGAGTACHTDVKGLILLLLEMIEVEVSGVDGGSDIVSLVDEEEDEEGTIVEGRWILLANLLGDACMRYELLEVKP